MSTAREKAFGSCIAAPAVVLAIWLTGAEVYRAIEPASPLFIEPPATSLAAAIGGGAGVEQAYRFIREGQDPNAPLSVSHADYTGGRTVRVSPLMLAVAARDENTVLMLLSFGARLELPQNRLAGCLARELNADAIAQAIVRHGGAQMLAGCPPRPAGDEPPLLSHSSDSRQ